MATFGALWRKVCVFQFQTLESDSLD